MENNEANLKRRERKLADMANVVTTWKHTLSALRQSDGVLHPWRIATYNWEDDLRKWPEIMCGIYLNI